MSDFLVDRECVTHHICDCKQAELESLRATLAELVREADWLVQCLQDIIAQKPVRGLPEAEAGFQAAWQKARELIER